VESECVEVQKKSREFRFILRLVIRHTTGWEDLKCFRDKVFFLCYTMSCYGHL
jgi:hypothetical protein